MERRKKEFQALTDFVRQVVQSMAAMTNALKMLEKLNFRFMEGRSPIAPQLPPEK